MRYVLLIGGLLIVGVVLFVLAMAALSVLVAISNRNRRRRLARFGEVVGAACRHDPSVVRVWLVMPFTSTHDVGCELRVEASGPLTTDFEPLRMPAKKAAGAWTLPDVVVVPAPFEATHDSDYGEHLLFDARR